MDSLKNNNIKGLSFVTNATGETTGLIIDLKQYPKSLEQTLENFLLNYETIEKERTEHLQATLENMNRCYGENEPVYSEKDLI